MENTILTKFQVNILRFININFGADVRAALLAILNRDILLKTVRTALLNVFLNFLFKMQYFLFIFSRELTTFETADQRGW